jgi:uncharacterized protein YjbJ (UPF0337 family)
MSLMTSQSRSNNAIYRGWLVNLVLAMVASLATVFCVLQAPLPAMAMIANHVPHPIAFAAMSKKFDAAAKDAEGKLQSAYGEITGDAGHQMKGKAKQVQASAMNVAEDMKQGAKSAAKKVSGVAKDLADEIK